MQGCSQSSVPFVCRLQSPESVPAEDLVDPSAWAPYGKSQGYAFAAVGPQAEGLQSLFLTPDGKLSDAWTIGGSQCKFLREDWAAWVRSVQRFYETVYRAYDAARRELPAEHSASIGRNYLISCPGYGYNFFENEVNLYFNRKSSEERFRRLAEKQSEVLRRSIVGFYVVGTRCEEQLESLQGVPCSVGDASFSGARDRCLGYFSGEDRGEEAYRAFRALDQFEGRSEFFTWVYRLTVNRALDAAHGAITNPLLDIVSMKGAKGVLINITGGYDMTLYEVDAAANEIRAEVDPSANIILGSTFDESMDGRMRVSVVATGIDDDHVVSQQTMVPPARRAAEGYSGPAAPRRPIPEGAHRDAASFDEPRPQFRREEIDAQAPAGRRQGGFNLFGWMRGGEEPAPTAPVDVRPVEPKPTVDASSDEDLEIPAFLRRQIQPPR
jgi:hypothetical protein